MKSLVVYYSKKGENYSVGNIKECNTEHITKMFYKLIWTQLQKKHKKCIIVSNLPYSMSSLVIIKFLKTKIILI